MRGLIIVAALCCVAVASRGLCRASGQAGSSGRSEVSKSTERAVRQVAEDWKAAYNAKDVAAVASLYAPDAYYVSAHVVAHGRSEIQAYFQRGIDAGGHIDSIQLLASGYSGDFAYTVGTYEATNAGEIVRGRNVVVLRKVGTKCSWWRTNRS